MNTKAEYAALVKEADHHRFTGYHHMSGICFCEAAHLALLKDMDKGYVISAANKAWDELIKSCYWHLDNNSEDSRYWIFFDLKQAKLVVRRFGLGSEKLFKTNELHRKTVQILRKRIRLMNNY